VVLTGIFIPSNNLYYAVKYSGADGLVVWRRYGPGGIPAGGALDAEGNVIVSGDLGGTNHVSYTAKYASASGQLLWEKRGAKIEDYVIAVVADVAGNVVVTGSSSSNGKPEYFATKYNVTDGAVLWERRYPRSHNAFPAALSVDPAGNVLVTGCVSNDYYTTKLAAADGMLLWEKRYNGAENGYDAASAISSDASGNAVVNGVSCNGTNCHYYTAKHAAADGALLWERHGPFSPREHVGNGLALDADGNAVITANSYRETNFDYYTAKYAAADGTVVWERRYDSSIHQNDFVAYSRPIAVGRNGVVAVTGYSDSNPGPLHAYDFATVVYRDKLLPLAIEIIAEGVRIRLTAISNGSYEVQRAGALVGSWSTIATVPAASGKTIDYVDTTQPTGAVFYRVRHNLPLGR
jgi:hypothetical protein